MTLNSMEKITNDAWTASPTIQLPAYDDPPESLQSSRLVHHSTSLPPWKPTNPAVVMKALTYGPPDDGGSNVIRSISALMEMTAGGHTSYPLTRLKRNSNVISSVSSEEEEDVDIPPKKPRHGNPSTLPSISFSFNQPKASPQWPLPSSPSSDSEPPHPRRHVLNTLYWDASKPSPRAFNEPTASEGEASLPSHLTLHWIID
ncbi:MAG: hypothetical protein Q9208_003201, partial [Pyrenodesmia sp. 3 TL-2023]